VIAEIAERRVAGDGVVSLREVTPADSANLYRWRMDPSARPMFRYSDVVPIEAHRAFVERYFLPGNRDRWYVIEADGHAVGALAIYDVSADGSEAEWGRFVIAPEHRGHGWGRRALRLLVEHARTLGLRRLRCEVRAGNPAERLYRGLGFVEPEQPCEAEFVALALDLRSAP
jgi:RimJ/RimL family protein N-acetyltransferase